MKTFVWTTAVMLLATCLSGCGQSDSGPEKVEPKSDAPAATDPSAEDTATTIPSKTPDLAVEQFLLALQTGDDQVAERLLTNTARTETKRHDMVVQPPGTPNATYELGRVEHPEGDQESAFVHCVWTERFDDENIESFEVVWILRLEQNNWRIAGMATKLSENGPPVFLNFEDPEEMMQTVREADAAQQQDSVATAPDDQTPAVR